MHRVTGDFSPDCEGHGVRRMGEDGVNCIRFLAFIPKLHFANC